MFIDDHFIVNLLLSPNNFENRSTFDEVITET